MISKANDQCSYAVIQNFFSEEANVRSSDFVLDGHYDFFTYPEDPQSDSSEPINALPSGPLKKVDFSVCNPS